MASLLHPPLFRLAKRAREAVTFVSDKGYTAHVCVLEDDVMHVALIPGSHITMSRTWSIAPGADDAGEEGRDRFDTTGFSCPPYDVTEKDGHVAIATSRLRLTIRLAGFHCVWEMKTAAGWRTIMQDRNTQAYNFGWWGEKVYHFLARNPEERHYGLGERSGDMDRALRRFRLSNTDAMGYSAKTSDPLYKHFPFAITLDPRSSTAFGLFYDTYADCEFDFGAGLSNYHGPFRSFVADAGELDYYVVAGPKVADVTRRFTWLTGRPVFPPRWALGYSGSTMSYTDAPDAQARMTDFLDKCRAHDILCDSFHLSSGYTSIGFKRHVFHWNREKFPDPAAFARSYHDAGVRLVANIKPCLLEDNPLLEKARANRFVVCDANGEPDWVQFWSGLGVYVDFTNPAARAWWRARVTESLLDFGIDATWNDNNEFEIVSPDAMAKGLHAPAIESKPLQTLLMLQSSRAAQQAFAPEKRPFLVTRAGVAGMQRYAQTWSGDNTTSWETLRYNIRMGLGLALSGVSNAGHDVGGFAGPAPDPELFVRWVEAGIFMPRFSIHSWNSDGTTNEPWMHESATPVVRDLVRLRYRLIPYLYDAMRRYARDYEPVWRPLFHDFQDDPNCFAEHDEYLLGGDLLVAPVCEPRQQTRMVYLPKGCAWFDFWSGERAAGGETVAIDAPLGRPVLFVREGAAIAMNIAEQHFDSRGDERAFAIFAPESGTARGTSFEDDGERVVDKNWGAFEIDVACGKTLKVRGARTGPAPPQAATLALLFRPNEARAVEGCRVVSDAVAGDWRKVVIALVG